MGVDVVLQPLAPLGTGLTGPLLAWLPVERDRSETVIVDEVEERREGVGAFQPVAAPPVLQEPGDGVEGIRMHQGVGEPAERVTLHRGAPGEQAGPRAAIGQVGPGQRGRARVVEAREPHLPSGDAGCDGGRPVDPVAVVGQRPVREEAGGDVDEEAQTHGAIGVDPGDAVGDGGEEDGVLGHVRLRSVRRTCSTCPSRSGSAGPTR